jgi:D-hydroxyproline dehydrogenase subunit alpha
MPSELPATLRADVAIVGAGPAGIAAAVHAAVDGRRVVVLDSAPQPGGQIWRHRDRERLRGDAREWLDRFDRCGATLLTGATVVDAGPGPRLGAEHLGRGVTVEAGALILATGAQELFLPFPGWTLPGVMGVGGAQALVKAGMDVGRKRVAVAGTGPLLLPVAAALTRAGADLRIVAEQASARSVLEFAASLWRTPARLAQAAGFRAAFVGARYRWGTWVTRVDQAPGADLRVTFTDGRRSWVESLELLATASGLVPSTELARLLGCAVEGGRVVVDSLQRTSLPAVYAAGEPTGNTGVEAALVEGAIAGLAASGRAAEARHHFASRDRHRQFAARAARAFGPRPELRERLEPGTIVCRCEDVPLSALRPEWGVREAKLAARAGMGSCQGRVCGAAMHHLFGVTPDAVRLPAAPVPLGVLADLTSSFDDSEGAP